MNDWLGRDDDGDGIPNAIDADPDTPVPAPGSSVVEDHGPTMVPSDAPPPANTAPVDAPPDASPSDARTPDPRPAPGVTPLPALPPLPTPPAPPADPTDMAAMKKYQAEMQEFSMLMDVYSNVLKQLADSQREIVEKLR